MSLHRRFLSRGTKQQDFHPRDFPSHILDSLTSPNTILPYFSRYFDMEGNKIVTETHPLEPFVEGNTRILMLGSFPPVRSRWCMDWFYPNFQNDMWRIWGYIYKGDKQYFVDKENRRFDKERIVEFCREIGLGLFDTGYEVRRLTGNSSDKFLEIIRPVNLDSLLEKAPGIHSIITTGELSSETLRTILSCEPLKMGESRNIVYKGRELTLWRCPSSSRSYPKTVEWKSEYYKKVLEFEQNR